ALVMKYLEAVNHLRHLTRVYLSPKAAYMADSTVFHMVERLVAGETVSFEGHPLEGLQIMGVLEARVIDFDNLFIPSMNEQIFPRRHFPKSFIPNVLRQAYGMLTAEHHEASYAYYFYRMLTRARHVWLTYDARQGATSGGDMSRFVHQLLRIYRPQGLTHKVFGYDIQASHPDDVVVEKSPEIIEAINLYKTPGSGKSLSPSSIRAYIECPLKFYLEYICHIRRQDDIRDWMDESAFGSVVHRALETVYDEMSANPSRTVTRDEIEAMAVNEVALDRHVTRAINEKYLKLEPDKLDTPLKGSDIINARLVKNMVTSTIRADRDSAPLRYVRGEYQMPAGTRLTLTCSEHDTPDSQPLSVTFNFAGTIDRIDIISPDSAPQLRIIDYKTGQEASDVKIDELVPDITRTSAKFSHAIVQLFFYAQALEKIPEFSHMGGVQPMVYPLRTAAQKSFAPVKIDGELITDHRTVSRRINDRIVPFINELFDAGTPFRPACDGNACTYCKFTEICGSKPRQR
ncbi:MAG: PD-(D/E)XK nuclease family protein, partial [Muribaculaceae bacterium]|nr:PD-(D/E)XK nuclease family protein [Muribaculaceae bacterium]